MATREQVATLRWFRWEEFRHLELMDYQFLILLDDIRFSYGSPMVLTSDARTPEENASIPGSSPTSLHLQGKAIDIRYPPTTTAAWNLVRAIMAVAGDRSIELELVYSKTDKHIHLGLLRDDQASRLVIAAE